MEKKLLFPAKVLVESNHEDVLRDEINKYISVVGLSRSIVKMELEEVELLKFLCGKKKHLEMSRGVIRNGMVQVTEGPLKGMESQIYKINRHKRLARLRMLEGKNLRYILAGLEIVEKSI